MNQQIGWTVVPYIQYLIPSASSLSIDINIHTYIVILKCVDTICNHTEMYR